MDLVQIIIIISLLSVSTVIIIGGIYLINLIKELKITISKANIILDEARTITGSITRPLSSISEFIIGFKNGLKVFNTFFHSNKDD